MIHELINNNNKNYRQRGKYKQESNPLVQILTLRNSPFYCLVDNFPDVCLHLVRQTGLLEEGVHGTFITRCSCAA